MSWPISSPPFSNSAHYTGWNLLERGKRERMKKRKKNDGADGVVVLFFS